MTTEESMQDEHLALAFECNRQLRADVQRLARELDEAASNCVMYKQQLIDRKTTQFDVSMEVVSAIIADMFRECYANSYLRGDEVAKIIMRRFGQAIAGNPAEQSKP